jgi:acetolactate synthase-1/3 small subunit
MPETTLTLLFTQRFGAVDRILSLLRRRGFPIGGMTIERTHRPEIGRMTVVVTDDAAAAQVTRHLAKLPDVLEVHAESKNTLTREFALIRIRCAPEQEEQVHEIVTALDARVLSVSDGHLVLEASGPPALLDELVAALEPFGIDELARTSPIALHRQPGEPVAESSTRQSA